MNRERQKLFGVGTIAVLLAHSSLIITIPSVLKILFGNGAIWAVRMFFFLSGIGLVCSAHKKGLIITEYYSKRVKRVLIPFWIIGVPFYFWQEIVIYQRPIHFFTKIFLVEYWISGKGHVWYLSVLIPLYLVFPVLYRILNQGKEKLIIVTTGWIIFDILLHQIATSYCSVIENMFTSVFAFLFGMLVADRIDFVGKRDGFFVIGGILLFPIVTILTEGNNILVRYCSCFVGISMSFILAYIFQKISGGVLWRGIKLIGAYSLELYITNVFLIEIVNYYFGFVSAVVRLLLILEVGGVLSYGLQIVSNSICKMWEKYKQTV